MGVVVGAGLAFAAAGNRLGGGGGYYDRFLARRRHSATSVGLAFETQLIETVPADARDLAVDMVVTDRRVTNAGDPPR